MSAALAFAAAGDEFTVICLCAQWCGTCRDYRAGFDALAAQFPQVGFDWLDIEERADELGDIDVENFPTVYIRRGDSVLFFGTMLPYVSNLQRLLETFLEQTVEQSRDYARATPERAGWQDDADLRALGRR